MELPQENEKPVYVQLADWLEDEILAGTFAEGSRIPSVSDISVSFKINHMTALKTIGILTEAGIVYKKHGIGMFVAEGAAEKIRTERRNAFYNKYIVTASAEAKKLGIELHEFIEMAERGYNDEQTNGK